jgi:biopolymer transport protein ExbD
VVIRADQSVSHGRVVAVMDRLRTLPGVQLAIATEGSQP